MAIRVACVALALAAGWGLSALPMVCLLEEAMYPFKPAICLTPVILTGAQDVPKLMLGSVNRKSQRKLGLKKTLLLFVICSCLGEENGYGRSDWCCSSTWGQGIFMKTKHPYLRLLPSKLSLQEGLHFPLKCYALCCCAWDWGRLLLYISVFTDSWLPQCVCGRFRAK